MYDLRDANDMAIEDHGSQLTPAILLTSLLTVLGKDNNLTGLHRSLS